MLAPINVRFLVTHSGQFHADDVCTAAILTMAYPKALVIRTRDAAMLAGRRGQPDTIMFDVGDAYDAERQLFDHHMPGAAKRDDGTTYSAFGLVWKAYGRDLTEWFGVPMDRSSAVAAAFDAAVVQPIDRFDTGSLDPNGMGDVYSLTLCSLVDAFNPAFDAEPTNGDRDDAFHRAVQAVAPMLRAQILAIDAKLRTVDMVEEALRVAGPGNPVLVLPHSCESQDAIDALGAHHVLYIIHPSSAGGYGVVCARQEAGSFVSKRPFPAHWAGLRGTALAQASGVPDAVFCHTGLFYASATSLGGARELARLALLDHA